MGRVRQLRPHAQVQGSIREERREGRAQFSVGELIDVRRLSSRVRLLLRVHVVLAEGEAVHEER